MRAHHPGRRRRVAIAVILAGLAAGGVVGCAPGDGGGGPARGADVLHELHAFAGRNGLLSTVPVASFAVPTVAATAYGIRLQALVGAAPNPTVERWRELWRADAEEPAWRAHLLCEAVGPEAARGILSGGLAAEAETLVADARKRDAARASVDQLASLDALADAHAAWCLAGVDLREEAEVDDATVLASVTSNAALALQWRDVLTAMGRPIPPVDPVRSPLAETPPDDCDDRAAMEAAAVLALSPDAGSSALVRCAVDDALDSDDLQVLLAAGRIAAPAAAARPTRPEAAVALAREVAARRQEDGVYRTRPVVEGSLSGTLAGVRLLTAGGGRVAADSAADLLRTMTAQGIPETGDALLVLAACAAVGRSCDEHRGAGLRAAEGLVAELAERADAPVALDGLLVALALVRPLAADRVDAVVETLRGSSDAGSACARRQVDLFRTTAASGSPPRDALERGRDELRAAVAAGDLTRYCDISWAIRLATGDARRTSATGPPSETLAVDADGYLRWGDGIAPLSVAASAADLDLYSWRFDD